MEIYFGQLLNVHKNNYVGDIEIPTAEAVIPDPTLLEVEIAIEKWKKYNRQVSTKSLVGIHYSVKSTNLLFG